MKYSDKNVFYKILDSVVGRKMTRRQIIDAYVATLGLTREDTLNAFIYSADIRDKYVLSRLFWDLGITDIASEVI